MSLAAVAMLAKGEHGKWRVILCSKYIEQSPYETCFDIYFR